ncbi:MAG: hypothetical protein AB4040_10245 [Synechococcus sp.]
MELVAHHVGSPAKVSNTEKKYLRDRWIDYLNAQCRSKGSSQKRWQTKGDRILSNFSITYIFSTSAKPKNLKQYRLAASLNASIYWIVSFISKPETEIPVNSKVQNSHSKQSLFEALRMARPLFQWHFAAAQASPKN